MKFTTEARFLHAGLKTVLAVIEQKVSAEALRSVRLRMEGGHLSVEGTDLNLYIKTDIDVIDGDDDFDAIVPAKLLEAAIRFAGAAPVEIKRTEDSIHVIVGDRDQLYTINTKMQVSDWPEFVSSDAAWQTYETFSNGQFAQMLDIVQVGISTEETRYYLNGVYWEPGHLVATDGHRLVRHAYKHTCGLEAKAIIPRKAVYILTKQASNDLISQYRQRGDIVDLRFYYGRTVLSVKTIDGTFPDYRRVMPKDEEERTPMKIEASKLHNAVSRAKAFFKAAGSRNAIGFKEIDGETYLHSRTVFHEEDIAFVAKLHTPWPEGADFFGVNVHYLKDFTPKSGAATLFLGGSGSPILIRHELQPDVERILMPMRV